MDVSRDLIEQLTRGLLQTLARPQPGRLDPQQPDRQIFLLDGSTLQLQERGDFLDLYPPARNQHGVAHWPMLRIVVLHDAHSGLALIPAWGPMCGPQAVSEQSLSDHVIAQMPADSVVIGDRNFGIFSVAYSAANQQQSVVLRLSRIRAQKIGGQKLPPGRDQEVVWQTSRKDRKSHPDLPADAQVTGRLLVYSMDGEREPLYLFTTLRESSEEVAQLYRLRWNIETDLRSLKRAAHLHRLTSKSDPMLEKELLLAMAAYNLVRTLMVRAAQQAKIAPRDLSFTHTLYHLNACMPELLHGTPGVARRAMKRLLQSVADCRLPKRKKRRSYPRRVWGTGYNIPPGKKQSNDALSK